MPPRTSAGPSLTTRVTRADTSLCKKYLHACPRMRKCVRAHVQVNGASGCQSVNPTDQYARMSGNTSRASTWSHAATVAVYLDACVLMHVPAHACLYVQCL